MTDEKQKEAKWTREVRALLKFEEGSLKIDEQNFNNEVRIDSESRLARFVDILFGVCLRDDVLSRVPYCACSKIGRHFASSAPHNPLLAKYGAMVQLKCAELLKEMDDDDDEEEEATNNRRQRLKRLKFVIGIIRDELIDDVELVQVCLEHWLTLVAAHDDAYKANIYEVYQGREEVGILFAALGRLDEREDRDERIAAYTSFVCESDLLGRQSAAQVHKLAITLSQFVKKERIRKIRLDTFRRAREENKRRGREKLEALKRMWSSRREQWTADNEHWFRCERRRRRDERRDEIERQLFLVRTACDPQPRPTCDEATATRRAEGIDSLESDDWRLDFDNTPHFLPVGARRRTRLDEFKALCTSRTNDLYFSEVGRTRGPFANVEEERESAFLRMSQMWQEEDAQMGAIEDDDDLLGVRSVIVRVLQFYTFTRPFDYVSRSYEIRGRYAAVRDAEWSEENNMLLRDNLDYDRERNRICTEARAEWKAEESRQIAHFEQHYQLAIPPEGHVWKRMLHMRCKLIRKKKSRADPNTTPQQLNSLQT